MNNICTLNKDITDKWKHLDEFDLQDLCSLLKEPIKNVNSCVSKGQLKTLCKQLLVENVALRKIVNNM